MTKAKKRGRPAGAKKTSKRKRERDIGSQTEQPFEQDSKRRLGQYDGTGDLPNYEVVACEAIHLNVCLPLEFFRSEKRIGQILNSKTAGGGSWLNLI